MTTCAEDIIFIVGVLIAIASVCCLCAFCACQVRYITNRRTGMRRNKSCKQNQAGKKILKEYDSGRHNTDGDSLREQEPLKYSPSSENVKNSCGLQGTEFGESLLLNTYIRCKEDDDSFSLFLWQN